MFLPMIRTDKVFAIGHLIGLLKQEDCTFRTMEFKRSDGAVYPQVYKTFESKGEEFYITDLIEDHETEALDLLVKYVLPEENFCKAIQILKKENAMKIICENYRKLIKKQMSLACFKSDTGELVGLNILNVVFKDEPKPEPVSCPHVTRVYM
jgi:hypothetical protein